jgi:hypothetical protein
MRIIMVKDKNGIYPKSSQTGKFGDAALELLAERVEDGYWYDDEDQDEAFGIVARGDGVAAWEFLQNRSYEGYEYETVWEAKI